MERWYCEWRQDDAKSTEPRQDIELEGADGLERRSVEGARLAKGDRGLGMRMHSVDLGQEMGLVAVSFVEESMVPDHIPVEKAIGEGSASWKRISVLERVAPHNLLLAKLVRRYRGWAIHGPQKRRVGL